MWREPYRQRFEDAVHGLLWRQWTALGVAGAGAKAEDRVVDPEALLLFTLEAARTEPRLFDEVLDWLFVNGAWIDVQRLRNLLSSDRGASVRLILTVGKLLARQERSAKWTRLASAKAPLPREPERLFLPPAAIGSAPDRGPDPTFLPAGSARGPIHARGLSVPVPILAPSSLRFRLRAFLGIGIRAEIVLYLFSKGEAHASDVAGAIGYSVPGVQQALREMSQSELVRGRRQGHERRYSLETDRWASFLGIAPTRWVGWPALFRGLAQVLRYFRRSDLADASDYLQASEFVRAFSLALTDIERSGLQVHAPSRKGEAIETFADTLAGWLEGWVLQVGRSSFSAEAR